MTSTVRSTTPSHVTTSTRYVACFNLIYLICYSRSFSLFLTRLIGQYCFARCCLSASSVVVCNAGGHWARRRSAAGGPGAWPVRQPTLHGGTVRLRLVKPRPHQQHCRMLQSRCCFDNVERCFDIVAQNGNNVEATLQQCCFDIVVGVV